MRIGPASHIFCLMKAFEQSEGDVLELGTGYFSTLLLHWMAALNGRKIVSYETKEYWYKRAKNLYASDFHEIIYAPDLDKVDFKDRHWGLVLIDHVDARREPDAVSLKDNATFLVLHDSDPKYKHYPEISKHFKYIYVDRRHSWTSVVSNFKPYSP